MAQTSTVILEQRHMGQLQIRMYEVMKRKKLYLKCRLQAKNVFAFTVLINVFILFCIIIINTNKVLFQPEQSLWGLFFFLVTCHTMAS